LWKGNVICPKKILCSHHLNDENVFIIIVNKSKRLCLLIKIDFCCLQFLWSHDHRTETQPPDKTGVSHPVWWWSNELPISNGDKHQWQPQYLIVWYNFCCVLVKLHSCEQEIDIKWWLIGQIENDINKIFSRLYELSLNEKVNYNERFAKIIEQCDNQHFIASFTHLNITIA
jgi:hypothetical protein